jgi:Rps23 Pro-64 3,4-dihydroxylase Tpa1-like proline 4-hydroxylase
MIKRLDLFPTKLYIKNLNLDNDIMIKKLYQLKSMDNNIPQDYNPWQSNRQINTLSEFHNLVNELKSMINDIFNSNCKLLEMWGSVYEKGQYNNIHNHPPINSSYCDNPLWVGVYYLKTSNNSGGLNIHSPINCSNRETFFPIEGDLYIFNSTTYHSVHPNNEDSDRLSIAFNLELINE